MCFLQRQRGRDREIGQVGTWALAASVTMLICCHRGHFCASKRWVVQSPFRGKLEKDQHSGWIHLTGKSELFHLGKWCLFQNIQRSATTQQEKRFRAEKSEFYESSTFCSHQDLMWQTRNPSCPSRSLWSTFHFHMGKSSPVVRIIYICACGWLISVYMG